MAFSVDKIDYCTAWLVASELADDGTVDVEQLSCMTNAVLTTMCDELKTGTTCLKIGINQDPSTITALSIRFYLQSIMAAGDNAVTPYTDANSVSGTNKNNQTYGSGQVGTWVTHVMSAAAIAELGNVGGKCYLRLNASDGTAKTKLSEVNIEMTVALYKVEGVTYDDAGDALGSVQVSIFSVDGSGVYTYIDTQVSNATTGAYSFATLGPGDFIVVGHKADTPHIFDVTDEITSVAV